MNNKKEYLNYRKNNLIEKNILSGGTNEYQFTDVIINRNNSIIIPKKKKIMF